MLTVKPAPLLEKWTHSRRSAECNLASQSWPQVQKLPPCTVLLGLWMLVKCGRTCKDFQVRLQWANILQWQEGPTRIPTRHQKALFTAKLTSKLMREAKAISKRSHRGNSRKSRINTCAVLNLGGWKTNSFSWEGMLGQKLVLFSCYTRCRLHFQWRAL